MKKILVLLIIIGGFSLNFGIGNYESKVYAGNNNLIFHDINEIHKYVYKNSLYCEGYGLISKDYKNNNENNKSIAYFELEKFCNNVKEGSKNLKNDVKLLFYKSPKDVTVFYIYIIKILDEKNIKIKNIDNYIVKLLNNKNFQVFKNNKLIFDFHKELIIVLLEYYKINNSLDKYFVYLKEGGNGINDDIYFINKAGFYVNKYGYIFSKLKNIDNLNKYKKDIIYIYGESYYNFIYSLSKLRLWFKNKINLDLKDINKYKNSVLLYYNLHKKEIESKFKQFNYNYDFNKDFFIPLNEKINKLKNKKLNNFKNNSIISSFQNKDKFILILGNIILLLLLLFIFKKK